MYYPQVIGGDVRLQIDEVGVPRSICMRMTVPEIATLFNRKRLQEKIIKGPDELGGALYIEKKYDGDRLDLMYTGNRRTIASQLQLGDTVERMLEDGDLVSCYFYNFNELF